MSYQCGGHLNFKEVKSRTLLSGDEMVEWHHQLNGHELVVDREAWRAAVRGVEKSWTRPSDTVGRMSHLRHPLSLSVHWCCMDKVRIQKCPPQVS